MNRRLVLLFFCFTFILTGILFLRGAPVSDELSQFLPKGATPKQNLAVSLIRTGPASRLILIALENATTEELAETSRSMVKFLGESELFSYVSNGSRFNPEDLDLVFRYRYLLDPETTPSAFNEQVLHDALQQRHTEISSALPLTDNPYFSADPTASFHSVIRRWNSGQHPNFHNGVWFTQDKMRALLVTTTKASGYDPEAQQQAIDDIQSAYIESKSTENIRLLISGAPVFANNSRNIIRSELKTLSITASILVFFFLFLTYRSTYILILSGIPIVTGLVTGSVMTYIIFGNIHGITLVFGITLLGVAIDYPIHLFSHLKPGENPRQSIIRIWPTLRLGVITTCIGYLAFVRQDFTGLAQIGIFTICGLIIAAIITRWLLPSLLGSVSRQSVNNSFISGLDSLFSLPQHITRTVIIIIAITLALFITLFPPVWESDLTAFSPLSSKERQLDTELRNEIGAPDVSQLIVISGTNADSVLSISENVSHKLQEAVAQGLLSDFDAPSRYLPSTSTQKTRQSYLPDPDSANNMLISAMRDLSFKQTAFKPFLNSLTESAALSPLTLKDVENTPIGEKLQSLIYRSEQNWTALVLLSGIKSIPEFRSWWTNQDITSALLLDIKKTSSEMLADFRNSALERLIIGILLILSVLWVALGSFRNALGVLLPVILAVIFTVAILDLAGERLSLFHLIALLLITGIGIDYSLFFQHRETLAPERRICVTHGLLVCAVSTFTVFGILATSQVPVLHAIGTTVSIGVPICFLLALASANADIATT